MKFLYPEFLFGLLALSIPIIIHLFNFRKAKKVYFSSTRFLRHVKEATSQKLKLKHYLILASRLLFFFFVVLAFAQPYLPSADKNPQSENVLIYIDNSQSMSNRVSDEITGLEQGFQYISSLLQLYPTNTNYLLLTNDFDPFSNSYKTKDEIEDLITEIHYSNVSRTLKEAYSRLKPLQGPRLVSSDVYIISDFQKSTAGDLSDTGYDSADQVIVTPVLFEHMVNIYIDSIYLDSPYLTNSEDNNLNVVLKNSGQEAMDDVPIKLFVNDIQSANSSVKIGALGSSVVSFPISFRLEQENFCQITFEDYPIVFDNEFFFVLKLDEKVRVLEVKSSDETSPFEFVFGNQSLFQYVSQNIKNVDYGLLSRSDLLILHELSEIDENLFVAISEFLQKEGVMVISPSADQADLERLRLITRSAITASEMKDSEKMAAPDFNNPFFDNVFEETNDKFEMPSAKTTLRWQNDHNTVFELRNGLKYLSEFINDGKIFLFASPLTETYTNFPKHALFVPTMYKIASQAKKSEQKLYYSINENAIHTKMDSLDRQDIIKMVNDEQELIPGQRISGNNLVIDIPKNTLRPGIYTLEIDKKAKTLLAFNRDKAESAIEQYTLEDLKSLFDSEDNLTIFTTGDADGFTQSVKNKKFGVPLWKYAVILALIFLMAEILLIRLL